jgi:trehalose-phosphatase
LTASPLERRLAELARTRRLLVACDYDGTLAPIVQDPAAATPLPDAVAALRSLAALRDTEVAVVSGRALRDLAALVGLAPPVHLVGSHGSELDLGFAHDLEPAQVQLLGRVRAGVDAVVASHPGVRLEAKPASVAVHVRGLAPDVARDALAAVAAGPGALDGVVVREGKAVVELLVVRTGKGDALRRLRRVLDATAVLFVGDDVTDEDAFAVLSDADAGVKVGEGATAAAFRAASPHDVARLLAGLLDARRAWLGAGAPAPLDGGGPPSAR